MLYLSTNMTKGWYKTVTNLNLISKCLYINSIAYIYIYNNDKACY